MRYTENIFKKKARLEEYIPLAICAQEDVSSANYVIYTAENSYFELVFDEVDHKIYRITMCICKNFNRINEDFNLPTNILLGDLLIDENFRKEANKFLCEIYNNAIKVLLDDRQGNRFVASDNILYELIDDELISITLYAQSKKVIDHTYKELTDDEET
jgi:hypothetical protein